MLKAVVAAFVLLFAFAMPAEAKRVALVIGESAYRSVTPLANPGADARLVSDALAAAGFDVQLGANLDRKGLETALQEFALDASQADVAVVYFAGHGFEADGQNWLIPVDARIEGAGDIANAAVPFDLVARSIAGAKVKIVAMDACRDNPFAARTAAAGSAIHRGLAEVELDGYVVIYAAAAGSVALDGAVNSPFATTFAHWVGVQNVDLRLLAGKIRDDVIATTAGAQRPFISASLPGEAVLLTPAPPGHVQGAATVRTRTPRTFEFVRRLNDPACVATGDVTCEVQVLGLAGDRPYTISDDHKLRIWNPASGALVRSESVPSSQYSDRGVVFLQDRSAIAVVQDSTIVLVPVGAGAVVRRTLEHYDNPVYLAVGGAPPTAVYAYPVSCALGFVDIGAFTVAPKAPWAAGCLEGELKWGFADERSEKFYARVVTVNRREPYNVDAIVVGSYRTHAITCRIPGAANDAASDAGGDLYVARDDGTVTRYDGACVAKRTYRLHQAAVQQVGDITNGRMLSYGADGAIRIWSSATGRVEHELTGLPRAAQIVALTKDGSGVVILNEDRRLYVWYGDARLDPYVGPPGPVCDASISEDKATLYAVKCGGGVEVWRRTALN